MTAEHAIVERTRALLARRLGVDLVTAHGEPFREGDGLAGDWIGAFAQPGVILSAATVMRASLTHDGGESVDEYGEATLAVHQVGDRVELRKQYKGRGATASFIYVGRLVDGTLAGYWYSGVRDDFGGVFWLARNDRLTATSRDALLTRVRRRSVRRAILYVAVVGVAAGLVVGLQFQDLRVLAGVGALALVVRTILGRRVDALRGERDRWRAQLGSG